MSLAIWHKCKDMPDYPPVHHASNGIGWFFDTSPNTTAISHCPWCGEKLKEPKEYSCPK